MEDRKKLLRDVAKIRHIRELFSVTVHVATGLVQPTDHEWIAVTLGSTGSQELLEKAKVCVCVCVVEKLASPRAFPWASR